MGWTDEIAADNPTIWLPLDVEGAASNGQEVPDVSGNELNGTLAFTGSEQAWGFNSFLETVPSSAYRGFGDGSSGLVGSSRITVPHDSLMAVTNDFACEGGVQIFSPIESAGTFGLIWKQGPGGIGLTTVGGGVRLCAFCFDSTPTLFVAEATFVVTDFLGVWFHVAAERVGNALALYINGSLNNTETITSGLPTASGTNPFRVHSDPGFYHCHYDEALFYTHSNGGARYLSHYEAAINKTLLNGYSNVVPTAILYSDEELPPISFPFRHNWTDPLIERISFAANNSKARSGKLEGSQPEPTPRREIELSQVLREDSERRRLRAKLWAHQDRKWFIPVLEDRQQLITTLSSGGNSIPVSPQYKDYEVDSCIGVRELNDAGQIVKSEELEIQTLNAPAGPIITKTNLLNTYQPYLSYAYPVRRAYIPRAVPVRGHTDSVEDLTIVARLLPEDEELVPNRITNWTPTILRDGFEVLDPSIWTSNDWSDEREYDIEREAQEIDFEIGAFELTSDTVGAEESFSYKMTIKGRDKIAEFLGWFYAREGSLNYLWVPTMQKDFKLVSELASSLTVEGTDYTENYALAQSRRDLAFVYHDNTMELRRVLAFTGSPNETLTLNTTVPTQTNLRSISLLKFCQMDGNTLEIAKYTDDVWRFAWRFRELLFTP